MLSEQAWWRIKGLSIKTEHSSHWEAGRKEDEAYPSGKNSAPDEVASSWTQPWYTVSVAAEHPKAGIPAHCFWLYQ